MRRLAVPTILLLAAAALAGCAQQPASSPLPVGAAAPDVDGASGWIGDELTLQSLRGQVVLIDFWTYSCINCIRTLPHLTGWYETYRDDGLVIIGVHTPEFEFEKRRANIIDAMDRFGIDYPVAQDNDRGVWNAYNNRYWPAKYLIDAEGHVRYTHFGEGAYMETEQHIRDLLTEAGHGPLPAAWESDESRGQRGQGVTPELYAGTYRQSRGDSSALGNPEGYDAGKTVAYDAPDDPAQHAPHKIYLDGLWHNGEQALTAETAGTVWLTFHAGAANFVADGPAGACVPITIDGQAPRPDRTPAGAIDHTADPPCIRLGETPRSYDFYGGPVETHTLRLDVPPGFGLYTFAFSSYPDGGT